MARQACFSDIELRQLIESPAASDDQRKFEEHLESCAPCRARLDELAGSINIPSSRGTHRFTSEALTQAIAKLRHTAPMAAANAGQDRAGQDRAGQDRAGQDRAGQDPGTERFSFLAPPIQPEHLGRLGKYEIVSLIGQGGMGVVFAAMDPALHRQVAIKVPAHSLVATEEAHDRFMREARAIASVKHDNIVTVHAVDEHSGTPYLVMELIDGQSLAQRLEQEGSLPWNEVARIGFETSAALVAAHARELVHRDVKPGNILIERGSGRIKVTDFGLAKSRVDASLTGTGILAGTPEFMSPEQANDEEVTEQSDFFSLGAVLYTACSGESPFRGKTAVTTLRRVCQDDVPSLHDLDSAIPAWFSDIIQHLMSKAPSDRPAASELLKVLSDHQSDMRQAPGQIYKTADSSQPAQAGRWPMTAAVSILALVGLLIAFYAWPKNQKEKEQETGFTLEGTKHQFSSLVDAVSAAPEGGVIDVHGDGPFLVPSLDAGAKSLVIRAAPGSAPAFVAVRPNERSQKPFLTAEADIQLQGIEVRWAIQRQSGLNHPEVAGRCIIDVSRGNLKLKDCRLVAGRMNGCLSVSNGSLELVSCHLISSMGPCCRWVPGRGSELRANNCVFQGRVAIMFDSSGRENSTPIRFDLTNNSFATYRAFHLLMDRPIRSADFACSQNAFDSEELLTLAPARRGVGIPKLNSSQARRVVMNTLDWTDANNAYHSDLAFLTRSLGPNREVLVSSLSDWKFLWRLGETGSIQVDFKQPDPVEDDSNYLADIRVPSSSAHTTSSAHTMGADLTIVGPRQSSER